MSSNSGGRLEQPPTAAARISVGNTRRPCPFIINDHRLRAVLEGVTPATVELRAGAYEIEVYSEGLIQSSVFQAEPGSHLDASDLGVPIRTDIPVSCAQDRDQFVAEAVSSASGALRDSRRGSGLVIIGLDKRAGDESHRAERDTWFTLLDATYKKLLHRRAEPEGGMMCWQSPLDPGGYVVRLNDPRTSVELPVWISSGFQTILFLPLSDSWLVDRASVHMIPIGRVWTGFDHAAGLLELALNNVRKGRRPFGEGPLSFDIVSLARSNPILGLVRLHDLCNFAPESTEYRLLAGKLAGLVPGHPDLRATILDQRLIFPPMLASGIPATLNQSERASNRIVEGSLLEVSYERIVRIGPLLAWQASKEGTVTIRRFPDLVSVSSGSTFPYALAASIDVSRILRRLWVLLVGALAAYRLSRRQPGNEVEVLQGLGKSFAARRIAQYMADLTLVGQSRRVSTILAGLNLQDLSEATSLPRSIVESALNEIRSRLAYTRSAEKTIDLPGDPRDL